MAILATATHLDLHPFHMRPACKPFSLVRSSVLGASVLVVALSYIIEKPFMRSSKSTSFLTLRSVMMEMEVNDDECRVAKIPERSFQCNAHALNTSVTRNCAPFFLTRAIKMIDISYTLAIQDYWKLTNRSETNKRRDF